MIYVEEHEPSKPRVAGDVPGHPGLGIRRRRLLPLAKQANGNARINELVGTPAADVAVMRKTGFTEASANDPDMKIIASQSGSRSAR
ncbi:hypothetical protein [Sorangium sp. So ce233]|uniref:hypothetical protein n=1 Tax=Sorangium sp. So ce233 TaxID=3133290 RepID=UPI003F5DD90E